MADSLARAKVFLDKIESSEGVDSAPVVATDLVLPNADLNIEIKTAQDSGDGELKGTFGPGEALTLKQSMAIALVTRLRGLGSGAGALLTPAVHAAFLASGHTVTTAGDGAATPRSAEYKPSSVIANLKTSTRYFYENGLLYKMLGSVNDLSIEAAMDIVKMKYQCQSKYTAPAAQALPAWAAPTQKLFKMDSATAVTEQGVAVNIGSFVFDAGVKVEESFETGIHAFRVADRAPTIKIDPRAIAGSAADWLTLSGAASVAIIATFSDSLGETLVLNAPKCVPMEISASARAGRQVHARTFALKETAGDDQYTWKWTAIL